MSKNRFKLLQRLVYLGAELAIQFALLETIGKDVRILRLNKRIELLLVLFEGRKRQLIDEAVGAGVDDQDLFFYRQRLVLILLEQFPKTTAAIELSLCRLI